MFYEVRIYTPKGNIKKVISREQLSKRHWSAFERSQIIRNKLKSLLPQSKV
jgi:hypothetical protein